MPQFAVHDFMEERIQLWDEIKKKREEEASMIPVEKKEITITLKDGTEIKATSHETSPFDIASDISKGLANSSVAAKVNDALWDLHRPLEEDCSLELVKFDSKEGKYVFWHSSAHVLGLALESKYAARLCIGPPLDDGGFYYDIHTDEGKVVVSEDYDSIKKIVKDITKQKYKFERLVLTREEALEMFKYNKFKHEIVSDKVPEGETCTAYRCGPLIDLCRGPHLPHTGKITAFDVTSNSSAYWKGDSKRDNLQRVYGISFPQNKLLKEWQEFRRLAAERDYRLIGKKQDLFYYSADYSPGSAFMLPHGARVYNKLMDFMRDQYKKRGFEEVISPNIYNSDLWKKSGHWDKYQENMFTFKCEDQDWGVKPMNCPGHCIMFGAKTRSYRELPVRLADFGVLHRNEFSGALAGLTRARRFQQDDAHIFCRLDQMKQEISGALSFMTEVYGIFGFDFELELSTRPEQYLGEIETWDKAEDALKEELVNHFGDNWTLNPGDGAFYGPKIDIHVLDAMRRSFQCATIQLDFQLPARFELTYRNENDEEEPPVIIHRAIFGSLERFMALLIEHIAGKWPFWLSPRQVIVCSVVPAFNDYAEEVRKQLWDAGYYADIDSTDHKIGKKIRDAQTAQYNFILVVGKKEVEQKTVNVRTRDNVVHGEKSVDALLGEFKELCENFK